MNVLILAGVLLASALLGAQVVRPCGDADDDGAVDILDARLVGDVAAGNQTLPPGGELYADVDNDGDVDILDSLMIGNFVVGLPVTLTCPRQLLLHEEEGETFAWSEMAGQKMMAEMTTAFAMPFEEATGVPADLGSYTFVVDLRFTTPIAAGEHPLWRDFLDSGRGGAWLVAGGVEGSGTRADSLVELLDFLGAAGSVAVDPEGDQPVADTSEIEGGLPGDLQPGGPPTTLPTTNAGQFFLEPGSGAEVHSREPGGGRATGIYFARDSLAAGRAPVLVSLLANRCLGAAAGGSLPCADTSAAVRAILAAVGARP